MKTNSPLGALRYSRAYTLSIEALHTLCCSKGNMRERLLTIDPEYFSLKAVDYPEYGNIKNFVAELRALMTRFDPVSPYDLRGKIAASIEQSHYKKRIEMAQLVWDIHREFSSYMQSDA